MSATHGSLKPEPETKQKKLRRYPVIGQEANEEMKTATSTPTHQATAAGSTASKTPASKVPVKPRPPRGNVLATKPIRPPIQESSSSDEEDLSESSDSDLADLHPRLRAKIMEARRTRP